MGKDRRKIFTSIERYNAREKAHSVRLALGALIIKEPIGLSDEETVEQITENPYLQYFIGMSSFQEEAPFHPSSMTHFRKRFGVDVINQVNEWMVEAEQAKILIRRKMTTMTWIISMGVVFQVLLNK